MPGKVVCIYYPTTGRQRQADLSSLASSKPARNSLQTTKTTKVGSVGGQPLRLLSGPCICAHVNAGRKGNCLAK